MEQGYDKAMGARPLRRVVETETVIMLLIST